MTTYLKKFINSYLSIINLPKGCEGTNQVTSLTDLLTSTLGPDNLSDPDLIIKEQVHWALFPRQLADKKLRPVIIRFLKYQDRERVLHATASRERNTISHDCTPVTLFPDMSPAVTKCRKEYDQVKKDLTVRRVPFALLHSTTLRTFHQDQQRFFKSPKEAVAFLHKLHPEGEAKHD